MSVVLVTAMFNSTSALDFESLHITYSRIESSIVPLSDCSIKDILDSITIVKIVDTCQTDPSMLKSINIAGHSKGLVWVGDRGTCPPHVFGGGGQKAI